MFQGPLVAIVTGAAGGIGRYTAEKLASRGMTLLLADRNINAANSVAADLAKRFKIRAEAYEVDVTKEEQVKGMVSAAVAFTGRIDYAANCVGVLFEMPGAGSSQTTLDVMQRFVSSCRTRRSSMLC